MTYDQCMVWQLYQVMYAHKQDKQVQVLTWKRVRDGLGIGLDTGLGIGLGAGLRSLPPLPRRGSTNRPLSGTTGCWGTAALRSRVSHVSEILRDVLFIIRPLPGVPVAGPSSTVSSSSRAAISLRTQYSLISATKARYWSRVLLSSCTKPSVSSCILFYCTLSNNVFMINTWLEIKRKELWPRPRYTQEFTWREKWKFIKILLV